jgi:hypothetical protein
MVTLYKTGHEAQHVRNELAKDDTVILIECFDPFLSFDYKTATMLEVDHQHTLACAHLNELGFNGDRFLIKSQQRLLTWHSTFRSKQARRSASLPKRSRESACHIFSLLWVPSV